MSQQSANGGGTGWNTAAGVYFAVVMHRLGRDELTTRPIDQFLFFFFSFVFFFFLYAAPSLSFNPERRVRASRYNHLPFDEQACHARCDLAETRSGDQHEIEITASER